MVDNLCVLKVPGILLSEHLPHDEAVRRAKQRAGSTVSTVNGNIVIFTSNQHHQDEYENWMRREQLRR